LVRNCSGASAIIARGCLALPAYTPGVQPDIVHEEDPQAQSWLETLVANRSRKDPRHYSDHYKKQLRALSNIWNRSATRRKKTNRTSEIYDIHLERTCYQDDTFDVHWPEVSHLTALARCVTVNVNSGGEMSLLKAVELMFNMEAFHATGRVRLSDPGVCVF
jgi:hypothetical protein